MSGAKPYRFEPRYSEEEYVEITQTQSMESKRVESLHGRSNNVAWCKCGECVTRTNQPSRPIPAGMRADWTPNDVALFRAGLTGRVNISRARGVFSIEFSLIFMKNFKLFKKKFCLKKIGLLGL
jgi:hypothetical protein